jgi:tetratricopeptide (TPR) repeat protein
MYHLARCSVQHDPLSKLHYARLRQAGHKHGRALRRLDEADAELRRSIELDPADWAARYDLAVVLYQKGNFAAAEASLRRALQLSATSAPAHLLLGLLLGHRTETRLEALEHLRYAARTMVQAQQLLHIFESE